MMEYRKNLFILMIVFFSLITLLVARTKSYKKVVLFDNAHAQTAGNADWTINGAYSNWAQLLKKNGFIVKETTQRLSKKILKKADVLVIPEPNIPFAGTEIEAILNFVERGGGLFLISDHAGSDRNNNGKDSVEILNSLAPIFGFRFRHKTLNEAPVAGKRILSHFLLWKVKNLPCWVGTSIRISNPKMAKAVYYFSNGDPYIVVSSYGKGRVVAIGDSSVFDDGSGASHKKLHKVFDSIRFDIPQFAYNVICYLAGVPTKKIKRKHKVNFFSSLKEQFKDSLAIDMTHGNIDVDQMDIFASDLKKEKINPIFLDEWPGGKFIPLFTIIMITDPFQPYREKEIKLLKNYLFQGGNLLIVGRSKYRENGHSRYLNKILKELGSSVRIADTQVKSASSRKPWVFKVTDINEKYLPEGTQFWAWSSAPLEVKLDRTKKVAILANSPSDCYLSDDPQKVKQSFPLVTYEKIGSGTLIVMGMSTFSNYQYPIRRKKFVSYQNKNMKPEKEVTGEFNLAIIKLLLRR